MPIKLTVGVQTVTLKTPIDPPTGSTFVTDPSTSPHNKGDAKYGPAQIEKKILEQNHTRVRIVEGDTYTFSAAFTVYHDGAQNLLCAGELVTAPHVLIIPALDPTADQFSQHQTATFP